MKLALGTALFVLLAGTTMYAQEQDKDKPAPHEEKKQEPAAKEHEQPKAQEQQKPQDQQKAQHQAQDRQKDQAKQTEKEKSDAAKQQQQAAHQQQQQAAKQQQVARQDHAQNPQAQRDGGHGNPRRIPEQDFRTHFGREHTFRVARSEDRRFNYGGYYWVYNDPWPSGWAYTDAVYVDEIDGEYYLIDPVHPGVQLLIVIAS
jgi:outer membrane biosynthesis protein TonB